MRKLYTYVFVVFAIATFAEAASAQTLGIAINKDSSLQGTGSVASPLGVNTTNIQVRVGSSCAAGSSIRAIASNGTVTCETDDGLIGTITTNVLAKGTGVGTLGNSSVSDDGAQVSVADDLIVGAAANGYIKLRDFDTAGEDGATVGSRMISRDFSTQFFVGGVAVGGYSDGATPSTCTSTGGLCVQASAIGTGDNTFFGWDAQVGARVGFTKKAGSVGKLTYGSGNSFAIAQSNAANIAAGNTFTDRLVIDSSGNISGGGNWTLGDSNADAHTITGATTISDDSATVLSVTQTASTGSTAIVAAPGGGTRTGNETQIQASSGASFDTTGGSLTATGVGVSLSASRSAGPNDLINNGVTSNVSGGQNNRAGRFAVSGTGATNYGLLVTATSTGTNNSGIEASATGAGTTNVGASFSASGAVTNTALTTAAGSVNLNATSGNTGVGVAAGTAPDAKLHVKAGSSSGLATALTGTVLVIEQANGTANYLQFRSNTTSGLAWAGAGSGGDGKLVYDQSINAMQFATTNTFRGAILSTGKWQFGDTSGSVVDSNVDVIEAGNTGTGQTTDDLAVIKVANSGSYNTTGAALDAIGVSSTMTSTRSAGANQLSNIAGYFAATGAQNNYGLFVTATSGTPYAIWTADGDVRLNQISGVTCIGTTGSCSASNFTVAGDGQTNGEWIVGDNVAEGIRFTSSTGVWVRTGTGTPEGAITAVVGSLFLRTDGGASTTLYVKESGSGNTGWVAK